MLCRPEGFVTIIRESVFRDRSQPYLVQCSIITSLDQSATVSVRPKADVADQVKQTFNI